MVSEFERQQGQGDALVAVSRTFDALSSELSQAVSADNVAHQRGAIIYTLPLDKDTTNTFYVPKWVGSSLRYRPGPQKAFYLSDSTGSYNRTGSILWRGVISGSYPFSYTIMPDPTWDANAQRGRISPVDSMQFSTDNWGSPRRVTVTVTASYRTKTSSTQMVRTLSIRLRNAD